MTDKSIGDTTITGQNKVTELLLIGLRQLYVLYDDMFTCSFILPQAAHTTDTNDYFRANSIERYHITILQRGHKEIQRARITVEDVVKIIIH